MPVFFDELEALEQEQYDYDREEMGMNVPTAEEPTGE